MNINKHGVLIKTAYLFKDIETIFNKIILFNMKEEIDFLLSTTIAHDCPAPMILTNQDSFNTFYSLQSAAS